MRLFPILHRTPWWGVILLLATSCMGGLNSPLRPGESSGGDLPNNGNAIANSNSTISDTLPAASPCTSDQPGPRAVRRLTHAELTNTLQDLFKVAGNSNFPTIAAFNGDSTVYGFSNNDMALTVGLNDATQLQGLAEAVASWAQPNLASLSPCSTFDAACQNQFVTTFGKKIFRQPVPSEDVAAYVALFAQGTDFPSGAALVVQAMLQSPYFLYRAEMGTVQGNTYALTSYEVASELSYLLTSSMPDDALLAAADANQLSTAAQISAQAQRLMGNARAQDALAEFYKEWLEVDRVLSVGKDQTQMPLPATLRTSMLNETMSLVKDIAFSKKGTVSDLYTADYTYASSDLASMYGLSADANQMIALGSSRTPGILGHAGLLTVHADSDESSPTLRGKLVRMRMLCQPIAPPPPNVPQITSEPNAPTTRAKFEEHAKGTCLTCHQNMDPIGYTFEGYDAFGRSRTQENGNPVDTSGSVVAPPDGTADVAMADATALAQYLAGEKTVTSCVARHLSMYAFGSTSWEQDSCTFTAVDQAASAGNYNLQSLLLAVTAAPTFTTRVKDP